MTPYLIRRLLEAALVFLGVTLVIYAMVYALPGDPIAALAGDRPLAPSVARSLRERYHLDDPLLTQYGHYLAGLFQGDLGTDFAGRSVSEQMADRWPVTVRLALPAWGVEAVVGIGLGVLAALRHRTWTDRVVLALTLPPLSFSRSCNGAAGLRARYDCVPSVEAMAWGVVSPGPEGAVGDADERSGHRPVRRNAGQLAGGRSA